MPTTLSGASSFLISRNQLIEASLRALGVLNREQSASASDIIVCSEALNLIVKELQIKGLNLWTTNEFILPTTQGVTQYLIGESGGVVNSFTIIDGGSGYVGVPTVTISGGGGSGASGTAILVGGIVTAITVVIGGAGYTSRPTVTIDPPLSGVTATSRANLNGIFVIKPLRVLEAFTRSLPANTDITLLAYSEDDYWQLGSKLNQGIPHSFWADNRLDDMRVFLYNVPDSSTAYEIHFLMQSSLQDVDIASQNVDLPREWLRTFKWLLMDEISLEFGRSPEIIDYVQKKATAALNSLLAWGSVQQNTSVYFQVDMRERGN